VQAVANAGIATFLQDILHLYQAFTMFQDIQIHLPLLNSQ